MYQLTQYEALDLARGWLDAIQTDFHVVLAVYTAYLVCAYTAGANLTRFQVSVINVGFLVFTVGSLFSFYGVLDTPRRNDGVEVEAAFNAPRGTSSSIDG